MQQYFQGTMWFIWDKTPQQGDKKASSKLNFSQILPYSAFQEAENKLCELLEE